MEEEGDFHPIASDRTMFVDRIDEDVATTLLERIESSDAMMAAAQFRVLGGAMARVPADATAFAHRTSKIMVNVAALFEQIEDRPKYEEWVQAFADDLRQSDQGAYVNFLEDEGIERVRAAYPGATWDRLPSHQAAVRPGQPVPAEPEHPAAYGDWGGAAKRRRPAVRSSDRQSSRRDSPVSRTVFRPLSTSGQPPPAPSVSSSPLTSAAICGAPSRSWIAVTLVKPGCSPRSPR